jgi:hypothetical protein
MNPKDAAGSKKLSYAAAAPIGQVLDALAMGEGAGKYGRINYRAADITASVYIDALKRHLTAWECGEECDADTQVPHLASARACALILFDAQLHGTLIDDRIPVSPETLRFIRENAVAIQAQCRQLSAGSAPRHYTIADDLARRSEVKAERAAAKQRVMIQRKRADKRGTR